LPLQILSEPSDPRRTASELRERIERSIEGARVEVLPTGPGHFEIRVTSDSFEGETRVRQQQRVYAAIAPLMKGEAAPVHAIDRLLTRAR
jgi:stress-induced morphogen